MNWLAKNGLDRLWWLRVTLGPLAAWAIAWTAVRIWEKIKGRPPAPALPRLAPFFKSRAFALALGGAALVAVAVLGIRAWMAKPVLQDDRYLVGAPYYVWYPNNFRDGFLRQKLAPAQSPALGLYNSADPETAQRHIAWASRYGLDFFALDWWPGRPGQNQNIVKGLMKASNLGDIKFCIFYETWDVAWRPEVGATVFDQKAVELLHRDVLKLAERFFYHPGYLRVKGRPVLFFYLTRTLAGDYQRAFTGLRRKLAERGFNPLFIADEAYWQVLKQDALPNARDVARFKGKPLPLADNPQMGRIGLFDAVTSYNMYLAGPDHHKGFGGKSAFLGDVMNIYRRYQKACGKELYFVPSVIPGYNDRGVRLSANHHVIPRQWLPGREEGGFFAQCISQVGLPFVDPGLNMLLITSWNEWNEDTNIEPVAPAPPTSRDHSPSGRDYTQGYSYAGYGETYLEVMQKSLMAVAGRVTGQKGRPVAHTEVCASANWIFDKGCDRTDAGGYYNLSRLSLPPGKYILACKAGGEPKKIELKNRNDFIKADFKIAGP